jgi:hypothetical protein
MTHPENRLTLLFSSTHWEHFFCPFVFNRLLGATFIFNIFFLPFLCFHQLIGSTFFPFVFNKVLGAIFMMNVLHLSGDFLRACFRMGGECGVALRQGLHRISSLYRMTYFVKMANCRCSVRRGGRRQPRTDLTTEATEVTEKRGGRKWGGDRQCLRVLAFSPGGKVADMGGRMRDYLPFARFRTSAVSYLVSDGFGVRRLVAAFPCRDSLRRTTNR